MSKLPSVLVIGSGILATGFSGAFQRQNIPVLGLCGRQKSQAQKAAVIAEVPFFVFEDVQTIVDDADVLFFAINDDAIRDVSNRVLALRQTDKKQVLIHCSGSRTVEDAFPNNDLNYHAMMHPMNSFADQKQAINQLMSGICFGISGDKEALSVVNDLIRCLCGEALILTPQQIAIYHAANCVASNYVVSVIDMACTMFDSIGINEDRTKEALLLLTQGSIANFQQQGSVEALTGPISRGDVDTVKKHLDGFKNKNDMLYQTYCSLGLYTVALAQKQKKANNTKLLEIKKLLCQSQ